METGLSKQQLIAELTKSPHGRLTDYVTIGATAAAEDPDFFSHLIAWNRTKGAIRDAKVALPVIALRTLPLKDSDMAPFAENACAHLALLSPRDLMRASHFVRDIKAPTRIMRRLVTRYLGEKEAVPQRFDRVVLQHRKALLSLYSFWHVKPSDRAKDILFNGLPPADSVFPHLRELRTTPPELVANLITRHNLPFLMVRGALGSRMSDPVILQAVIQRMSPAELVTNMKALERLGVKKHPVLRAALEAALGKAGGGKRGGSLKATRAAEAIEAEDGDDVLATKLRGLQERQLDAMRSIDGNWLVLADKSSSMQNAMEVGRAVAAILARMVKGHVHLVFFNSTPTYFDVTGRTYEDIKKITDGQRACGQTGIGCGLQYALERRLQVDGIAIISDGGENQHPDFCSVYARYKLAMGTEPTVYHYHLPGDIDALAVNARRTGLDIQRFPLDMKVDYHSLPNLVQTMRIGRYQLLDEIQHAPLLTLDMVLASTAGLRVLAEQTTVAV